MAEQDRNIQYEKEVIFNDIVKVIKEISPETGFNGSIGPDTLLGSELELKSIDLVRLFSAIKCLYSNKPIQFQDLLISDSGDIRLDIKISQLVHFLYKHLYHD